MIARPQTLIRKKPVYTIHKCQNSVMAWNTSTPKTTVIGFSQYDDVQTMAQMIEYHYSMHQEWPDFNELSLTVGDGSEKELRHLIINEWDDLDSLQAFCVKYYFDLALIEKIRNQTKLTGNMYTLTVPYDTHSTYLEELYLRPLE